MFDINSIKIKLIDSTATKLDDISDEEYFKGDKFKGYVSNSSMGLINPDQGGSPTKFLTGFKEKKNGGALELGTAVHRMLLEKDKYYIDDVVKPSPKVCDVMENYFQLYEVDGIDHESAIKLACEKADYYSKSLTQTRIDNVLRDGKVYLESLYDWNKCQDCITLTQEHKDKLDKCMASVKANDNISAILNKEGENFQQYNEDCIIMRAEVTLPPNDPEEFEDKINDLWIKVKIDNWSIDFDEKVVTLNDLKTTGGSIADFAGTTGEKIDLDGIVYKTNMKGSFEKFHYYRQMALYMKVLRAYVENHYGISEEDGWKFKCNMLVVETNEPHYSHVFEVGHRWLNVGTYEYESLLKRIGYHNEHGYDSFTNIKLNGTTIIW